jgi:hypothetical protein
MPHKAKASTRRVTKNLQIFLQVLFERFPLVTDMKDFLRFDQS